MTSRRPMTRSYSGNGRTSSFEEEGSSSNRESRNTYLSNVRPENSYSRHSHYRPPRSTLCSVMAQLTEDIQPSFEKTLKSKAVSENCNVKFTCVVTGYPAPELTWYKDDMQMDRYCGLPKYEINRNGKNHTLQIYNCTLDDAAIYQASASNTKGIVSCSGVLEVGTMSEFLIHQRFFAKLKQKADNKKKDLEGSKKIENVPKEQSERSPQRPPRKRPVPPPATKEEPPAVEPVVAAASEPNGASADIEEAAPQTPTAVIIEKKDDTDASPKDNVAIKKLKISNGVDGVTGSASSSRGHAIVNGRQNSYDGGISLAQFLAETVSAQAVEEKQAEKTCEMDASVQGLNKEDEREKEAKCKEVKEVEKVSVHVQEHERLRVSETELQVEREKERERQTELQRPVVHHTHSPAPKSHRRGHKDHEHHNIQASLTSVLHSVKDFFFGKGKKDSHDHRDNEETEDYNSKTPPAETPPQTPPLPRLEDCRPHPEEVVPMESDESREPSRVVVTEPHVELGKPLTAHGVGPEVIQKEHFPAPAPQSNTGVDSFEPRVKEVVMTTHAEHRRSGEAAPMSVSPVFIKEKEKLPQKSWITEEFALTQKISTVPLPVPTVETQIAPTRVLPSSPDTQTRACGEASTPATLSYRTVESAPLGSINETVPCYLKAAGDQLLHADATVETGPSEPQDHPPPNYPLMSQTVQEQAEIQMNETRMDTALSAPSLEEQSVFDSAFMNQVPIPIIIVQADKMVSESMEVNNTPLIQTANIGDLSTVNTVDISEKGDFKMQEGGLPDGSDSTPAFNLSVTPTPVLEQNEDIVPLQEHLSSAFDQKHEVNANLEPEELPLSEIAEKTRETQGNEGLTLFIESESKRGKEGEVQDLNEPQSLLVARDEEETVRLSESAIVVGHPDDTGSRLFLENNTESEPSNSTSEDTTDIKVIIPENVANEKSNKTGDEVKEPEIKKTLLPLITLTSIRNPPILQNDRNADISITIIKEKDILVSKMDSLLPKETSLLNEDDKPPADKTQEGVQLHAQTEIQLVEPHRSEHTVTLVSIPVINVSCTDENQLTVDVPVCVPETDQVFNAPVIEDPKIPLLVVPPISIICNDIPVESISVPSQQMYTVTGPYQGGETHVESLIALESPSQAHVLNGAQTPAGVTANTHSLIKTTEAVGDAVTHKKKPMKQGEKEPDDPGSEPAKDRPLQPDKLPVERLDVQPQPTPALSPASLRRFLSRAGPRSDSPTAMAVPAITVGDSQSDKTGEELSGGSTPTSSLSCESSPRLKRRDSMSLIRSATPEELASGARRKIFVPRSKGEDGGEGAGLAVLGVAEAPYMSPGQARRAALLQSPAGQNIPGVAEAVTRRESPFMSPGQARRASLLQAPTVQNSPGVPDALVKRETPFMSPGQARRAALLQAPTGQNTPGVPEAVSRRESPYMSPSQGRRTALLQAPTGQNTPPLERRSPMLNRRRAMLEVPKVVEEKPAEEPDSSKSEEKPAEKEKLDPFKAPQVIRKIRGEPFPDASGHLKLWCQFFNILSDSTVKWYRDEVEILEVQRSGGDESQVALAIVQASSPDCGVYGCTIKNEYGTDTTDFLLSMDILSDMLLKDDLEVGEEVEMTPLRFTKGLADVSCWGDKFFGRIMTKVSHMGEGCAHKACRIKVIYGLDPVFESGSTCVMKVQSPIPYETKEERNLAERNLEMTKQECKIQNMIREYCKIFAAEARVIENFGFSLEVLPQYLMYRPANTVPYATVETDLPGVFLKYCHMDTKGRLITRTSSEVEQKCCTFQHWIHQWTHGNLLVTNLQGVETKLTNIRVATKSKGYQGLTEQGSPELLEQFAAQHQCNYYCGLLGLRSLKAADSLQQPSKIKGSRSPLLQRKLSTSSSPVLQRRGVPSPLTSRKATASPKVPRKAPGTEENNPTAKANPEGTSETVLKS
ncbi:alpha-protein kinase 3 isoform X1 [Gadus chalcogrammus]|uniref:alpha-protein kinase 3 isoform X1 n=1 Tax=Gadus chalcogrammus TaxID=1042646 RepID=UPI0024C4DDB0|nr:alpha-protein kinase 3 isoform X1 [Gadus chalcogrammus]